jgi:hypothetical protein
LVSPSRQCSLTPVGFGQEFLSKNNATTLEHPPYSPDLATDNSYLFPRLEVALNGRGFCGATDSNKNAKKQLKIFHIMASENVTNTFTVAGRSVYCHKGY